jgi:membrane-bound lytic murein transglycosylase D
LRHNRPSNVPAEYRNAPQTPPKEQNTKTIPAIEDKEQVERISLVQKESNIQNAITEGQAVDSVAISPDSLGFDSKHTENNSNVGKIEQDSILTTEMKSDDTLDTDTTSVRIEKTNSSIQENEEIESDVQLADENDDEPNFDENQFRNYSIKKGDTFFAIANKFNMKISTLLNVNDLGIRDTLSIGQVIKVDKNSYFAKQPIQQEKEAKRNESIKQEEKVAGKNIEHKVTSGDTMYALAKKYDVSLKEIMEWNNKQDYSLKEGELILIKQK